MVLDKIEHLSGMLALTQLIMPPPPPYEDELRLTSETAVTTISTKAASTPDVPENQMSLDAVRLIELSDRTSAVMKSSNVESLLATDPLLDIFSTFTPS